ncbi:MAG: TetR/AcrR family transcriptional regulator [Ilumatobacter sp.]|nr:TetR/AcrR family transcriptional regulator [Ilumatobacter sp.]
MAAVERIDVPQPSSIRRRGRPPATNSADTRQAILKAARALFAERGYGAVTNKDVASVAGITTGALYHYVESKLDLYAEVDRDMQRTIYRRFQDAVVSSNTFLGKLTAVLEAAHQMGIEDPSLAGFVGAVRTDTRRHPEIDERLSRYAEAREQFFVDIVDAGLLTGEISPAHKPEMVEFVRTVLVGLTETVGMSPEQHRRAVDAVTGLLRGTIFTPLD